MLRWIKFRECVEAEFARDWTIANAGLKPIRKRLRELRAEIGALEFQEQTELQRAQPEIERVESRKRSAQELANEQHRASGDLIRTLHEPAAT